MKRFEEDKEFVSKQLQLDRTFIFLYNVRFVNDDLI